MRGLKGKTALVTGGTGFIGSAIVRRLAEEGVQVFVGSRDADRAANWIAHQPSEYQENLQPIAITLDNDGSIRSVFDSIETPHLLIANASRREELATPFSDVQHQHFTELFKVDVAGHFLAARLMVEKLAGQSGSIIFLSSIYGVVGVDHSIYPPGMSPTPVQYAAVKAGMSGLTRYLAALWGRQNIRVNTVVAGGVRSRQQESFVQNYAAKTALGRMAVPDEIASAVAFLASDDAAYITGHDLVVDGGFIAQ